MKFKQNLIKMKFTPIVLASLLLTLISCRKGDPIEGKVMNLATNLPVQNLTVTLRKGYFGSDFGSSKGKAIDVTTTNTSGVYNFENTYKKKDRSDMYVYIDNEDLSRFFKFSKYAF